MIKILTPGVIASLGDSLDEEALKQQLAPSGQSHLTSSLCEPSFALGSTTGICHRSEEGIYTAISGNYQWVQRELSDRALSQNAGAVLAYAYREYGFDLLNYLSGRFSLAVWDDRLKRGLVATDKLGRSPVYWQETANGLLVAPTAHQIHALSGNAVKLQSQALYNYLFFHMVPSPGTIYQGVNKLPAANALRVENGTVTRFKYWTPNFEESGYEGDSQAHERMLKLLETSVAQLDSGSDTGAFLSGGLDSSSVVGMLARSHDNPDTFSIGFDAEGYDEIAYARIANKQFNTNANEYYVTPEDVLEALPKVAAAYDEPFGNSSAIPAYFCARLAKEKGMSRLLAGDGGDELFAGNERYAKQRIFEFYQVLPESVRKYLLEPTIKRLPRRHVIGKMHSYIEQASVPLPARLHSYNFLARFAPSSMFTNSFMADVDVNYPYALEADIYAAPDDASRLNRMMYLDWQHTLADNDLRKVNRMCELAGIEVEYPMLDDELVAFSTQVPSRRKMPMNRLRGFYKDAVSGFLPDEIINKSKHGFGLPFGVWMANHAGLQEMANANLAAIRDRDILQHEFMDELLKLHQQSHAGYYGELVWILVMLELWLDQHGL